MHIYNSHLVKTLVFYFWIETVILRLMFVVLVDYHHMYLPGSLYFDLWPLLLLLQLNGLQHRLVLAATPDAVLYEVL